MTDSRDSSDSSVSSYSSVTATGAEASLGELERLVSGQHHDPHSILGAHPGPDGVVVRALRPLARSVTLVLDDGRRVPMAHLYQGVFTVTLPDEKMPDYRIATCTPRTRTRPRLTTRTASCRCSASTTST